MSRTSYAGKTRRAPQRMAAIRTRQFQTRWGPVEYVDEGSGPAVLISLGVSGGLDEALDVVRRYVGSRTRTLGTSPFGYLASVPLEGASPADQVDAHVALLDHLGISRVVALGFSTGSPTAIHLALRYPSRLHGLILASAYLPGPSPLSKAAQPPMHTVSGLASEPAGAAYPLEDLRVPTLIVHAADDPLAGYDHAVRAAPRIPGARLVTVASGGHLFAEHEDQVRSATAPFIRDVVRVELHGD